MSSFRSWNKSSSASVAPTTPAPASETSGETPAPSNPFGNMRRERDRYNHAGGMSYTDWKQTEKKKKDDEEKNRPLTEADFPPLGGKVVVPVKKVVPGEGVNMAAPADGTTLADRIRLAIKRQEDDALRRRLEMEEEEKKSKDTLVSLPRAPMLRNVSLREVRRNLDEETQAEEDYAWQVSGEIESPGQ